MAQLRIWYKLLNPDGSAHKGATADSVMMPEGALVVDLRKEVKKENPTLLASVESIQLLVYSSTWTPGSQELPLEEDALVGDSGKTKKDALVVVVPEPPVTRNADIDKYVANWFSGHPNVRQNLDNYEDTHNNVLLTYRLDDRLTKFNDLRDDDTKVMVGVSGSGKTRTILEVLYHKLGFYFTCKVSDRFGSKDLMSCKAAFASHLGSYKQFFKLLLYVRHSVITQLLQRLNCRVRHVLHAQINPVDVFGCDLFNEVFEYFAESSVKLDIDMSQFPLRRYCAAVDEIQLAFREHYTFDGQVEKPFFTPMMDELRTWFGMFIVSGTGINYPVMKARLASHTAKSRRVLARRGLAPLVQLACLPEVGYEGGAIKEVNDFAQLGQYDSQTSVPRTIAVSTYVEKVLLRRTGLNDRIAFVSEALENFELCHGRPRLCAGILEQICKGYHSTFNVEDMVEQQLVDFKTNYFANKSQLFSFMNKSDWRTFTLDDDTTLSLFLKNVYVSTLIMPDRGVRVSTQAAVQVIERGIGYRYNNFETGSMLKFTEPLVNYLLPDVLTLEECRVALLGKLGDQPDRACGGKWFEFLVAYGFASWKLPFDKKPRQSLYPTLADYIKSKVPAGEFYLPEACCGPDIVYRIDRTLFIVQVKLREKFVKGQRKVAADTTNPKLFYCHRKNQHKAGEVLENYKKQRKAVDEALRDVDYDIKRFIVTHTATNADQGNEEGVVFIDNFRRGTGIEGFNLFGDDGDKVWEFVDKVVEVWKKSD